MIRFLLPEVTIVLAERSPAYLEASQAVSQQLAGRANVTVTQAEGAERLPPREPAVVVALGTRALRAVLANGTRAPVIATLIPRSAFESELKGFSRQNDSKGVTAVFLDQPFERQLNLVRIVAPGKTRVGVLASPATQDAVQRIESAARERGLSIVGESVDDAQRISTALARLLGESELLLALPDPSIFNASTIHNILLSALRAQQPLIGFSEAYVRAGALAAVYSKPRQVGHQAGEIAAQTVAGAPLPPPQYPKSFSVSVNPTVARTLGLAVEEEAALAAKLQRMEREP
ncbi:MAG: hypothetical protein HYX46_06190 [Betaproteobacteria bacterium]|nr:hypothetical protein [Betaproteobacteria bacterium]